MSCVNNVPEKTARCKLVVEPFGDHRVLQQATPT